MKRRIALVLLLACGLTATHLLTGCGTLGNGQLDLPVEITVEYHDNFGNGFVVVAGPDGIAVPEARYASVKTGALYEITETGGFLVTAPDGQTKVRIRRADQSAINNQKSAMP